MTHRKERILNSPEVINAVDKLITFDWFQEKAAQYFDNTQLLNQDDFIAVRATFISDVMRNRFKPAMEELDSNCAVYLKMTCKKMIQEKIANHMREQENSHLAKLAGNNPPSTGKGVDRRHKRGL